MLSSFTVTEAALPSFQVSWKESVVSSETNKLNTLIAVMSWAVISTAMIPNHGFLCFLMFSGFNKCLTKYETQGTAVTRCGNCKFYMHFKHSDGHGLNTFAGKK